MSTTLEANGRPHILDLLPDVPLLLALREHLALVNTKYGNGIAQCDACITPVTAAALQGQNYAPS